MFSCMFCLSWHLDKDMEVIVTIAVLNYDTNSCSGLGSSCIGSGRKIMWTGGTLSTKPCSNMCFGKRTCMSYMLLVRLHGVPIITGIVATAAVSRHVYCLLDHKKLFSSMCCCITLYEFWVYLLLLYLFCYCFHNHLVQKQFWGPLLTLGLS